MAIEPVNERPLFPSLNRPDAIGVSGWSVDLVRQLITVFQQYGYKLNKTLLEENLAAEGGSIPEVDRTNTWVPVQVFQAAPTATGHPLRWDELAENGGTIPETNRDNTFNGDVTIIGSSQGAIVTTGAPGSNTVLEIGHQNEASITAIDLHCSGNNNDYDVRIRADNTGGDGTTGGARLQLNAQVVLGAPTGDTQGKGTLNAQAVYDDGTLLTDYVFDAELDKQVDSDFYDRVTPDREIKGDDGRTIRTEKRVHTPARQFSQNMDELDPKEFEQKWRSSRKLPAMARAPEKPSLGEYAQALLETCEVQAVHIAKLEARISALEDKQ